MSHTVSCSSGWLDITKHGSHINLFIMLFSLIASCYEYARWIHKSINAKRQCQERGLGDRHSHGVAFIKIF